MADRSSPGLWRLYVITDPKASRGRSHLQVAEAAIAGGADVLQLRDKEACAGDLYREALQLRKLTRDAGIPFIVNDRLDIALAADADGVHVGQADLPASVVRRILGPVRDPGGFGGDGGGGDPGREGRSGLPGGRTGVRGAGNEAGRRPRPWASTASRGSAGRCGLPIVAIGGINAGNARSVREAGADAAAVISAIGAADDIADAVRRLKRILDDACR